MSETIRVLRERARLGGSRFAEAVGEMIKVAATRHEEFTSDVIWDYLDDIVPNEPRVMGAVFNKIARAGHIEATDRVRASKRRECHGRPVRVWKSKVFVGVGGGE